MLAWLRLVEDDVHLGDDDGAWWYNERAILSLFAGAVWRCKGFALEEYTTSKRRLAGLRGKPPRMIGRGDLRCWMGRDRHRREFVAEAKVIYPSLTRGTGDTLAALAAALSDARADVQRSVWIKAAERLAIVFVSPCVKTRRPRAFYAERIGALERELRDAHELRETARAWTFPLKGRTLVADGYLYPGIVMVIDRVG